MTGRKNAWTVSMEQREVLTVHALSVLSCSFLANFASTQCPSLGIGKTQTVRWQLKVKGRLSFIFSV